MKYITTVEAAEKWGVSLRWVQTYLKNKRIEGAVRCKRTNHEHQRGRKRGGRVLDESGNPAVLCLNRLSLL